MPLEPAVIPDGAVADPDWLPGLTAQAQRYVEAAKSENTRRAYRSDWAHFVSWCQDKALAPLPADPAGLILYLTELAGQAKVSTLTRRLSAISQAHQLAGHATPTHDARVRTVMAGIRRTRGTAPQTKRPVLVAELKVILDSLPSSLLGVRDRALLLVGWSGAFRRSELVAVDVEHLAENREGLVVTIGRSKTDQAGKGHRDSVRTGRSDLPRAGGGTLAGRRPDRVGRSVPRHESAQPGTAAAAFGRSGGPRPEALGGAVGLRSGGFRRPQLTGGSGDFGRRGRQIRARHHATDRTQERRHGPALHP